MATTLASNGSVNAMHGSMSPLAGGIAIFNMMLGEVIFGGVGSGLYGIVLHVVLTVFIAGLMVGRTPEYLGKKIESADIVYAVIGVLLPSAAVLPALRGFAGPARGACKSGQQRPARPFRNPLCLHLGFQQQRQRICRA